MLMLLWVSPLLSHPGKQIWRLHNNAKPSSSALCPYGRIKICTVIAIKLSLKHWDREPAHWMVPWGRSLVNPLLIFINRGKGSLKDRSGNRILQHPRVFPHALSQSLHTSTSNGTTALTSISIDYLCLSYKSSRMFLFSVWGLISFVWHYVCEIHPCCLA